MRGDVAGLPSPHPIGAALPAVYAGDDVAQRLGDALDAVLAPIVSTLDCFESYLDPRLAPADFVGWLGGWVAVAVAGPEHRRERPGSSGDPGDTDRELVAGAVERARWRGTRAGVADLLSLLLQTPVTVEDSGGCTWSADPDSELPGTDAQEVVVTVAADSDVDRERVWVVARREVPAHCRLRVDYR